MKIQADPLTIWFKWHHIFIMKSYKTPCTLEFNGMRNWLGKWHKNLILIYVCQCKCLNLNKYIRCILRIMIVKKMRRKTRSIVCKCLIKQFFKGKLMCKKKMLISIWFKKMRRLCKCLTNDKYISNFFCFFNIEPRLHLK